MKLSSICLFLCLVACTQPEPDLPELNYQNIKYLTLSSTSQAEKEAMADQLLQQKDFVQYLKLSKDDSALQQAIKQLINEFESKKQQLGTYFVFEKAISRRQLNVADNTVNLMHPFTYNRMALKNKEHDPVFPQYINIYLSNFKQLAAVNVNEFSAYEPDKIHMKARYTIELVKSQYRSDFQAVIKKVEVFDGMDPDNIFYQFSESRDSTTLVNNKLMSNGYSLQLVSIHSFSFFGRRVQDPFLDLAHTENICHKTGEFGEHDLITCHFEYLKNQQGEVFFEVLVAGGRMAEIRMISSGSIAPVSQEKILEFAMSNLSVDKDFLLGQVRIPQNRNQKNIKITNNQAAGHENEVSLVSWDYFGVHISYDPSALASTHSEQRVVFELKGHAWMQLLNEKKG